MINNLNYSNKKIFLIINGVCLGTESGWVVISSLSVSYPYFEIEENSNPDLNLVKKGFSYQTLGGFWWVSTGTGLFSKYNRNKKHLWQRYEISITKSFNSALKMMNKVFKDQIRDTLEIYMDDIRSSPRHKKNMNLIWVPYSVKVENLKSIKPR